ncbi:cytochrome b6 [Tanacetum coccineum]
MGSKKEGVFRGGPKGYSVSIPKTVKKQESKSSCCFRSLSESRRFWKSRIRKKDIVNLIYFRGLYSVKMAIFLGANSGTIIFGGRIPTPEDAPESFRMLLPRLGFAMTFYYCSTITDAFASVQYIMTEANFGWLIRSVQR